jgi:hypothetical protein
VVALALAAGSLTFVSSLVALYVGLYHTLTLHGALAPSSRSKENAQSHWVIPSSKGKEGAYEGGYGTRASLGLGLEAGSWQDNRNAISSHFSLFFGLATCGCVCAW